MNVYLCFHGLRFFTLSSVVVVFTIPSGLIAWVLMGRSVGPFSEHGPWGQIGIALVPLNTF